MTSRRDPESVNGQAEPTAAELDASDRLLTEVAHGAAHGSDPLTALLRTAAGPGTAAESIRPPAATIAPGRRRRAWASFVGRSVAAKVAIVAATTTIGLAGAGAATGIVAELRADDPAPSTTAAPSQVEPPPTAGAPAGAGVAPRAHHVFGPLVATCLGVPGADESPARQGCAALLERDRPSSVDTGAIDPAEGADPTTAPDADRGTEPAPDPSGDQPGNGPGNNNAGGNQNNQNNNPGNNNAGGNQNPGNGPGNNNAGGNQNNQNANGHGNNNAGGNQNNQNPGNGNGPANGNQNANRPGRGG